MEVRDIAKPAVTISDSAVFFEAVEQLMNGNTNTLLVTDADGQLVGEVTVADLLDGIIPTNLDGDAVLAQFTDEDNFKQAVKDAREVPVSEFMSLDFTSVTMDDGIMAVASTAIAHQRARIPVVDKDNRPVGIISRQGIKQIIAKFLEN